MSDHAWNSKWNCSCIFLKSWNELLFVQNHDRQLWKLGTLPPGLITFWKRTFPIDRSWHVLGLGYNPSVNRREIERAAVIHYNGNLKPWLEIGMPKFRNYWAKFADFDNEYLRDCNINPWVFPIVKYPPTLCMSIYLLTGLHEFILFCRLYFLPNQKLEFNSYCICFLF